MTYPASTAGEFGIVKGNQIVQTMRYSEFLIGNQQFSRYVNLFDQYRIRGASLEVTGVPKNINNGDIINTNPIVAGISHDVLPLTFNDAMQVNSSLTVNPIGKVRKYNVFPFTLNSWYSTQNGPNGGLYAHATGADGTNLDSPSFTYKLTLYLLFRHSKL